jgi:hypothetical protein
MYTKRWIINEQKHENTLPAEYNAVQFDFEYDLCMFQESPFSRSLNKLRCNLTRTGCGNIPPSHPFSSLAYLPSITRTTLRKVGKISTIIAQTKRKVVHIFCQGRSG